jgi:hypothetical protein
MKLMLIVLLSGYSLAAISEDSKDFNQLLIDDVKQDIQKDSDQFRTKKSVSRGRGPASVSPMEAVPEKKIERMKQTSPNW